ncbi:MAG: type II secretion system GspH family protein [Lentisphaeraceae bacterium]|nr:type II secretion system GspH family protein [Lentisphaeraceae bacterium]
MKKNSFTLLELSVVMLIIVSLASLMVSQGLPIVEQTIDRQYQKNAEASMTSIIGDNSIRDFDGSVVPFGYLNDVGSFPEKIEDLWEKPESIPEYSKNTFTVNGVSSYLFGGWKGPYFNPSNENLKNNLRLERLDHPETGQDADAIDDDDDVKLFALGYSDAAIIEYGEENFTKRTIEILGVPPQFTTKVHYFYIQNGTLISANPENITGSADLSVNLPKGVCAFYAEFLEVADHTVSGIIDDVSGLPSDDGEYFIKKSAADLYTELNSKENQIVTKVGADYTVTEPDQISDTETLYDQENGEYYIFDESEEIENDRLKIQDVKGKKTSRVIKTIKTDIVLNLE